MRIRLAVPDSHVSPDVLDAALEASTRANQSMLRAGEVPPISELINAGKVKWAPEPFKDGEHFDLLDEVHRRVRAGEGWADCDDLAPAYAAELRENGTDPDAFAAVVKSGPSTWHAKCFYGDGSEAPDPSKAAGMGRRSSRVAGLFGTSVMGMASEGAILGVRPARGRWAARCDVPEVDALRALSGVAIGPDPCAALVRAIDGAFTVGVESGGCDPTDLACALAVRQAVAGESFDEAVDACGEYVPEEVIGSIFSSVSHALAPIAHLVPKKVLKAVVAPSLALDEQLQKIPGMRSAYRSVSQRLPFHAEREAALRAGHSIFDEAKRKHTAEEIRRATAATSPTQDPTHHLSVTRSADGGFTVRF